MTVPDHSTAEHQVRDGLTEELFARLEQDCDDAEREQIVAEIASLYLGLCSVMAGRYEGRGVEHDDLVQVARLALVKAIHRYRPGRGPSFAAFAVPTISGELKRHFRDRGWLVRPPRWVQELRLDVQGQRAQLEQQRGRTPRPHELAEALDTSVSRVSEVLNVNTSFRPLSLDVSPSGDEGAPFMLVLAAPDQHLESVADRLALKAALSKLPDHDRDLICMRFGEEMTQTRISHELGISQMAVSRALRRVLATLRGLLDEDAAGQPAETAAEGRPGTVTSVGARSCREPGCDLDGDATEAVCAETG